MRLEGRVPPFTRAALAGASGEMSLDEFTRFLARVIDGAVAQDTPNGPPASDVTELQRQGSRQTNHRPGSRPHIMPLANLEPNHARWFCEAVPRHAIGGEGRGGRLHQRRQFRRAVALEGAPYPVAAEAVTKGRLLQLLASIRHHGFGQDDDLSLGLRIGALLVEPAIKAASEVAASCADGVCPAPEATT